MPGIAVVITRQSPADSSLVLELMLRSMQHEPFYSRSAHLVPECGLSLGTVSLADAAVSHPVRTNETKDVVIAMAGECFCSSPATSSMEHWILRRYEQHGLAFIESLNGVFSGVIIDRRQRRVVLFNDRYGVERLYWAETAHGFLAASEAKAILAAAPELRTFDEQGVAEFLQLGCTTEGKTLFRGVSVLPPASRWSFDHGTVRKETYFSPATWESQPVMSEETFQAEFESTMQRVVPKYFAGAAPLGISLTAGLDTRMIMAFRPDTGPKPVCFTYSGQHIEPLDVRIARKVAQTCGWVHHALAIKEDFFSQFDSLADQTVYVTDGCFGVTGAHEIYMSRQAHQLAPLRLTGNYGGEILRGVSTFKSIPLAGGLIHPDLKPAMRVAAERIRDWHVHQITFAAFREIPWNLFGNLQAGKSQLAFRTPYLDNELVALAYRAPESLRRSRATALRLIQRKDPKLAAIPTDRAYLGDHAAVGASLRRALAQISFKLDYINNEGLPNWLSPIDSTIQRVGRGIGILGLHKHLHYRSWFRRELAPFITERMSEVVKHQSPFWNQPFVTNLARDHIAGSKNYVLELNAVLTLEAVARLMLHTERAEPQPRTWNTGELPPKSAAVKSRC